MKIGSKEKFDPKIDIFQRAQQIKKEAQAEQAAKIMNAYRKVQDIKVKDAIKKAQKKVAPQRPESQYANKVKQTLKEMNANRHKEQKEAKTKQIEFKPERSQAERHLIASSCRKIFKVLANKLQTNLSFSISNIKATANQESDETEDLIRLWKLKRIFCAWQYEAMLNKIEATRVANQKNEKLKKMVRLADDFRYFSLMKKSLKFWSSYTKKMIKKRAAEQEERKIQIAEILQQKKAMPTSPKRTQIQKNHQLQNKLRGFLDNLKHQIDGKDRRLNTIKQKTEDSQLHIHNHTQNNQEVNINQVAASEFQENEQHGPHQADNAAAEREQESVNEQQRLNGPLTNQQLEKRRKQIAEKAKSRKQALEKLKKEKEQQRKRQQEQRIKLEKQIEDEQRKARQEQYRKFLKQKKEQEQWEERQKQLNNMATQFNKMRTVKYYGWLHWKSLKQIKKQQCEHMKNILLQIVLRRKLKYFVDNITSTGNSQLRAIENKMNTIYNRKLLKKCLFGFKKEKEEQLELKEELATRHQVNMLKIYLKAWIRGRPELQLQNFEWERPRMKRAECLHNMTLMDKTMKALKINQQEQIQARNIKHHKERIRKKIQNIVEEEPTIDYDQFL